MNAAASPDSAGLPCLLRAWDEHRSELAGFLNGRARSPSEAEDILQEVFVRAVLLDRDFCDLRNSRAWLFEVARNLLIDYARRAKPTVPVSEQLAAPIAEEVPVESLAECLPRTLAAMPEDDRDILVRCDIEGKTQRQYAGERGLTLPATKARIQRARDRLRKLLVERCRIRFDDAGRVCCHKPMSD